MGEVSESPNAVTLRTSIVGRELTEFASLVEWFLAQKGAVRGFANALYSGMTTDTRADLVLTILERHPELWGLYQATSDSISKCDLLGLLNEAFGKGLEIVPDDTFYCDRRMDGSVLQEAIGWKSPEWTVQIARLSAEGTRDRAWR
jgi:dTDP-4-dehydrorhamnose reductase